MQGTINESSRVAAYCSSRRRLRYICRCGEVMRAGGGEPGTKKKTNSHELRRAGEQVLDQPQGVAQLAPVVREGVHQRIRQGVEDFRVVLRLRRCRCDICKADERICKIEASLRTSGCGSEPW